MNWFRVGTIAAVVAGLGAMVLMSANAQDKTKGDGKRGAEAGNTGTIEGALKTKYLRKYSVVVYIEKMSGKKFDPPKEPAEMDQKGKKFIPRILPVLKGTTVKFLNSDSFDHNVKSPSNGGYDLGTARAGKALSRKFDKPGVYTQLCSLHPEMIAYIIVSETPYWAVLKKKSKGSFTIPNVPVGTWKMKVWCERFKKSKLSKTFTVTVKKGETAKVTIRP